VLRLERVVDGAADGMVAAFAVWTVAYEVALVTESPVWGLGVAWVVVAVALAVLGALTNDEHRAFRLTARRRTPPVVVGALGVLLVVAAALRSEISPLPLTVLGLALLALGLLAHTESRVGPVDGDGHLDVPPERSHAGRGTPVALVVCLTAAVFASFLRRTDADDAFYLNRATWVAERGVPVVRDTMFGPETYPSTYGRGLPFPSFESLIGSLAHLLDVRAATLAYVGLTPVLAFACLWATWRLVRAWAVPPALPVFLAAAFVMLVSGATIVGGYGVGRLWQGKVVAFAVLTPLIWVYLTRTVTADQRGARRALVLLLLSGVAFAGLTSGAPLLVPTFAGAALLAALVLRHGRLAAGAGLLMVGPVVAGVSVVLGEQNFTAEDSAVLTATATLRFLFGTSLPFAVLGIVAVVLAVRALRPEAAVLAGSASAVALLTLLPGVADLADALTGAGPIAWRLATLVPIAVLVGVLLVEVVRRVPTTAGRAVAAVVVAVGVGLAGTPLWLGDNTTMASEPGWKVDPVALDDVEAVLDLPAEDGTYLLPPRQSEVLAVYTTEVFATVPRLSYVPNLDEDDDRHSARFALYLWLNEGYPLIPRGIRERLDLLGVGVLCVPADDPALTADLDAVAADSGTEVTPAGSMACAVRRGGAWAP
jgi:hypothetical protein